jgi:biopolymer transport protein TolR
MRKRRLMNQIRMWCLIDVTLVLLVIFMVTAPVRDESGVVELPEVGETLKQTGAPIVITELNNTISIAREGYTRDRL